MPIYKVTTNAAPETPRLIKAKTRAGAVNFATKGTVLAEEADPEDLFKLAGEGVILEDATAEAEVAKEEPPAA